MKTPLVLDIDASLRSLEGAESIPLAEWQEAIRFGCSWSTWKNFRKLLDERLPADYGTVCMGSGDFHHISHLLLERRRHAGPFDVVVLDNHPDNMRFPFGIHCGSWVKHAARLPGVRNIHVLGITSGDVGWRHAWENHLGPLFRGKVRYWTIGVDTAWARPLGLGGSFASFDSPGSLVDAFVAGLDANIPGPVYLSIDKDVFSPDVARTNWDQGCFDLAAAGRLIEALKGRVIGSDITGEISAYRYQARWKRWLSAMDDQESVATAALEEWQAQQMAVNVRLLDWLKDAGC